jgi:hypothetical protein
VKPSLVVEVEWVVVDEELQEGLALDMMIGSLKDLLIISHVNPTSQDTTTLLHSSCSRDKESLFKHGMSLAKILMVFL